MSSSISVAVRVRPFSDKERSLVNAGYDAGPTLFSSDSAASGSSTPSFLTPQPSRGAGGIRKIVKVLDDRILVFDPPETNAVASLQQRAGMPVLGKKQKDIRFCFDRVFDEDCGQEEVYNGSAKELVGHVMDGFNSTVFAYGATGCGKTHTISGSSAQPGIVFLLMKDLFDRISAASDETHFSLTVSYLEIYNETIRDLLAPENGVLQLRDSSDGTATPANLTTKEPTCPQDVVEWITLGNNNRTVNFTEANATSSRSHAVLQVSVTQKNKASGLTDTSTTACLSVIDLAGSERASATKNRGDRAVEGANINRSLLALGNCINALCDPRKRGHVPYRDSKLTRLLKQSLGGNCKTVMIVCVSPSSAHYDETHNTLQYANRAKEIKTKAVRNTLTADRHVAQYCQQIMEQQAMIADLKRKLNEQETRSTVAYRAEDDRLVQSAMRQVAASWEAGKTKRVAAARAGAEKDVLDNVLRVVQQWQLSATANVDVGSPAASSSAIAADSTISLLRKESQDLVADLLSTTASLAFEVTQGGLNAMEAYSRTVSSASAPLRDRPAALSIFSSETKLLDSRLDAACADARTQGLRQGLAVQTAAMRRMLEARLKVGVAFESAQEGGSNAVRALARLAQSVDQANNEAFAAFAGESNSATHPSYGAAGIKRDAGARSPFLLDPNGKVPRSALTGFGSAPTGPHASSPSRARRSPKKGVSFPSGAQRLVSPSVKKNKVQWRDEVGEEGLEDIKYGSPIGSTKSGSSSSTPAIAVTSPRISSSTQMWTVSSTYSEASEAAKAAEEMQTALRAKRPAATRLRTTLSTVTESPSPFSFHNDQSMPPPPVPSSSASRPPFADLANSSTFSETSFSMAPTGSGLVAPVVSKPVPPSPAPPTPSFKLRRNSHIGPVRSDKAARRVSLSSRPRPSLSHAPAAADTSLSSSAGSLPSATPSAFRRPGRIVSAPALVPPTFAHPPGSARRSPRKPSLRARVSLMPPTNRRLSTLPSAGSGAAALAGMQPTTPAPVMFGAKSAARIAARRESRLSGGNSSGGGGANTSGSGSALLAGIAGATKKDSPSDSVLLFLV
ncbi:kinesin family member 18/19 [Rhodotorula toruloides]|uniref:Kinesin family member 18/19 n=1 Tax=Rhodotorula toruloides TaxID=5286 RepID=A0A511K744_RHOTO|nr:kinesin family member 18/19 [Rhodotorula toruloides]